MLGYLRVIREKELELRSKLSQLLVRGKVDFSIFIDANGGETTTTINKEVVNNYIDQLTRNSHYFTREHT